MRQVALTGGGTAYYPDAVVNLVDGRDLFVECQGLSWANAGEYVRLEVNVMGATLTPIWSPYVDGKVRFYVPYGVVRNNDYAILNPANVGQTITFQLKKANNTVIAIGTSKIAFAGHFGLGNRKPAIPVVFGYTNSADFGINQLNLANMQLRNATFRGGNIRYIRDYVGVGSSFGRNLLRYNAPEDGYQKPQWAEIQALDGGGVNVALSKTVTADFTAEAGMPLSRVTDGDLTFLTEPNIQDNAEHYVQVDLGSIQAIEKIIVHHGSGGSYNNRTMVSSNGTDWVEVNNVMGWSPSTPKTIDLNQATYTPAGGGSSIGLGKVDIFAPSSFPYATLRMERGGVISQYGRDYPIIPICKNMVQLAWVEVGSETVRAFWFTKVETSHGATYLGDVYQDYEIPSATGVKESSRLINGYYFPKRTVKYTSGIWPKEIADMIATIIESPMIWRYVPENERWFTIPADQNGFMRTEVQRSAININHHDGAMSEVVITVDESYLKPKNIVL